MQYADATLSNALPNTLAPGGPSFVTDGLVTVKENSWAVGFNLGVMLHPLPGTRVGLTYRSGITQPLQGNATISSLTGPLAGQNGTFSTSTDLNLPNRLLVWLNRSRQLPVNAGLQWFNFEHLK